MKIKKAWLFAYLLLHTTFIHAAQMQAQDFEAPRLSPLPLHVAGVANPLINLNGDWGFQIKGLKKKSTIKVPGEWTMQGFTVNEGEIALYTKSLHIPADWLDKSVRIRFNGVSSHAVIKLNGKTLGSHEGSFVPFELDLTPAIQPGENILEVAVEAWTVSDRLATLSQYAVHTVGGLLRNVTMFVIPKTNLRDITIRTTFDANYKNATLGIDSKIDNPINGTTVKYTLKDATGKIVLQKTAAPGATNIQVGNPRKWDTEHPNLYTLETQLLVAGNVMETNVQKIGFRDVKVKGQEVFVNGSRIKLRGVCRHSVHPFTGRAISDELEVKDAVLLRDANNNYVRTSHYPASEAFLNACDSLGIFVESESALCWIGHPASPIWWYKWNYKDEKFLSFMMAANLEKMQAEKNHPSIIIWSLGNESTWSPLWEKVNAAVKQFDPSRPVAFQDQSWGGFNNAGSKTDIANFHYPGLTGDQSPAATDKESRPMIFDEYAHLPVYDRRALLSDPGERTAYNNPLIQMYDSMYAHKGNLGGAIWSGIDDIFHLPDGRIVGYGPWGPIDAWRRPKPEYWGMKKAYSPVRITNVNTSTASKGYVELTVENRYDFTPLSEVSITADVDGIKKGITSAIAARNKGIIKIPVTAASKAVHIQFKDPRGFIADEESISLGEREAVVSKIPNDATFTETDQAIVVVQNGITYNIAKETGVINSIRKGDEVIISQGPVFMVAPINGDTGGKSYVAGATYQNDIYPLKNYPLIVDFAKNVAVASPEPGLVKVSMDVTFNSDPNNPTTAKQTYTFSHGELITNYEIVYKNRQTNPYQYGLLLQLPKTMNKLTWDRKPGRTMYPDTDISRWKGTAILNAKHVKAVEEWGVVPRGDWKDDAMDMGSNDFRSTKRHIYMASLSDEGNASVTVFSDGKQSSRSWLQDEHIQWLIADFSNRGSEDYGLFNDRINIGGKTLKGQLRILIQ